MGHSRRRFSRLEESPRPKPTFRLLRSVGLVRKTCLAALPPPAEASGPRHQVIDGCRGNRAYCPHRRGRGGPRDARSIWASTWIIPGLRKAGTQTRPPRLRCGAFSIFCSLAGPRASRSDFRVTRSPGQTNCGRALQCNCLAGNFLSSRRRRRTPRDRMGCRGAEACQMTRCWSSLNRMSASVPTPKSNTRGVRAGNASAGDHSPRPHRGISDRGAWAEIPPAAHPAASRVVARARPYSPGRIF